MKTSESPGDYPGLSPVSLLLSKGMREKVQHSNQFQVHLLYEGEIVDVLFNYLNLIIKEKYVQSMLIP